jgi:ketosteroid isomerase-like protein
MNQPNEGLVRATSAAFGRGDLSTLRSQYFAENVVWHVAGTGPLATENGKATEIWTHSTDPADAAHFWS